MIELQDKAEYMNITSKIGGRHWKYAESRWSYHQAAIDIIRNLNIKHHYKVLEMGTMGVSLVKNSHTIDYDQKWNYKNFSSTYLHDARNIPWPITTGQYDCFIALRVWQHLYPFQKECFLEAKRISKNIILVIPESYSVDDFKDTSKGIPRQVVYDFNDGIPSKISLEIKGWGVLYFFEDIS